MLRHTRIIYAPNLAACADFLMKERVRLPVSSGESAAAAGVAGASAGAGAGARLEVQMNTQVQLKVQVKVWRCRSKCCGSSGPAAVVCSGQQAFTRLARVTDISPNDISLRSDIKTAARDAKSFAPHLKWFHGSCLEFGQNNQDCPCPGSSARNQAKHYLLVRTMLQFWWARGPEEICTSTMW